MTDEQKKLADDLLDTLGAVCEKIGYTEADALTRPEQLLSDGIADHVKRISDERDALRLKLDVARDMLDKDAACWSNESMAHESMGSPEHVRRYAKWAKESQAAFEATDPGSVAIPPWDAVWSEVVRLCAVNARHKSTGVTMGYVPLRTVIAHLRAEVNELDELDRNPHGAEPGDAELEIADIFGIVLHLMHKFDMTIADVSAMCLDKFAKRFEATQ